MSQTVCDKATTDYWCYPACYACASFINRITVVGTIQKKLRLGRYLNQWRRFEGFGKSEGRSGRLRWTPCDQGSKNVERYTLIAEDAEIFKDVLLVQLLFSRQMTSKTRIEWWTGLTSSSTPCSTGIWYMGQRYNWNKMSSELYKQSFCEGRSYAFATMIS